MQSYYGIRLYDENDKLILDSEFANMGDWIYQEIDDGSILIGLHGFIYNGAIITKIGMVSAKISSL